MSIDAVTNSQTQESQESLAQYTNIEGFLFNLSIHSSGLVQNISTK